jgi:adenylate kinase
MIKVINLKVPDEVLIERMLARGRADDTEETIKNRIKVYYEQTTPLIDYYKRLGVLIDINGDQTIEEVFNSIRQKLDNDEYEFDPGIEEN